MFGNLYHLADNDWLADMAAEREQVQLDKIRRAEQAVENDAGCAGLESEGRWLVWLLGERLRLIRALPERVGKGETLTADEILLLDDWRYLHAIRTAIGSEVAA